MTDRTDHTTLNTEHDRFDLRGALDWRWMLGLGIVLLIGGFLAFLNPFVASLTVSAIAAATFATAGAMQIWMALRGTDGTGSRIGGLLMGAVFLLFAVSLVVNPIAGLVSLTILAGAFFFAMGALRVWMGLKLRGWSGWGWMTASGALSIALALLIFFSLPEGALGLLGLFFGIELVGSGTALTVLAWQARKHG